MNATQWTVLLSGIPTVVTAIISLIMAVRNGRAIAATNNAVNGHLTAHDKVNLCHQCRLMSLTGLQRVRPITGDFRNSVAPYAVPVSRYLLTGCRQSHAIKTTVNRPRIVTKLLPSWAGKPLDIPGFRRYCEASFTSKTTTKTGENKMATRKHMWTYKNSSRVTIATETVSYRYFNGRQYRISHQLTHYIYPSDRKYEFVQVQVYVAIQRKTMETSHGPVHYGSWFTRTSGYSF